jgi:hypothetical protein
VELPPALPPPPHPLRSRLQASQIIAQRPSNRSDKYIFEDFAMGWSGKISTWIGFPVDA